MVKPRLVPKKSQFPFALAWGFRVLFLGVWRKLIPEGRRDEQEPDPLLNLVVE